MRVTSQLKKKKSQICQVQPLKSPFRFKMRLNLLRTWDNSFCSINYVYNLNWDFMNEMLHWGSRRQLRALCHRPTVSKINILTKMCSSWRKPRPHRALQDCSLPSVPAFKNLEPLSAPPGNISGFRQCQNTPWYCCWELPFQTLDSGCGTLVQVNSGRSLPGQRWFPKLQKSSFITEQEKTGWCSGESTADYVLLMLWSDDACPTTSTYSRVVCVSISVHAWFKMRLVPCHFWDQPLITVEAGNRVALRLTCKGQSQSQRYNTFYYIYHKNDPKITATNAVVFTALAPTFQWSDIRHEEFLWTACPDISLWASWKTRAPAHLSPRQWCGRLCGNGESTLLNVFRWTEEHSSKQVYLARHLVHFLVSLCPLLSDLHHW